MEAILVPVNLTSLAAAIEVRVAALNPASPPQDIITAFELSKTIETVLGRLVEADED